MKRLALTVLALLAPGLIASAQQGGPNPGVNREAMWPAPTVEDWSKPVLIQWQRNWDDAVAVSKETGKPILVCVNMDGEIASEHYAGIRYRQPEITQLYEPYVPVIASVYRHNPRDYDDEGRRVECPRFGTVTCGEHIVIEPALYGEYFEGVRVAPRHIMVELDGEETYDVYYAWDTDSVFTAIREGIQNRPVQASTITRGDRSMEQRVASRDSLDREQIETAYREGDAEQRRQLLEIAIARRELAPVDMLRLAVFGLDLEMARLARRSLAESTDPKAIDLIVEALRVPMQPAEREALISALERLGDTSARARSLAVVHRGLDNRSSSLDVDSWSSALGGGTYAETADRTVVRTRLARQDEALGSGDPDENLKLAESFLEFAYEQFDADPEFARHLFIDARDTARTAEGLGASGWRVEAALAIAAHYLGEKDEAHRRAEAAVKGGLPEDAPGWNAMAVVAIFAQARQEAIQQAVTDKIEWPPEWLTDVRAAYAVLAKHPYGTDEQVAANYDFLNWLGAVGRSRNVLWDGLARFPDSVVLHERLRTRVLWARSPDDLEALYDTMLAGSDRSPALEWFAGLASMAAAEAHRRAGNGTSARSSYDQALVHFTLDATASPETAELADHEAALALAGRARLALERGDEDAAVIDLVASFGRYEQAAATLDGLNISPSDTARMLFARLIASQREDLLGTLQDSLSTMDPTLLQLPEYERNLPPRPDGSGSGTP